MKKIAFLLLFITIHEGHGQKLLHLKRTVYGSVVPYVQTPVYIDPSQAISKTDYPHNTSAICKDSVLLVEYSTTDTSRSNPNWGARICADNYSIPFSHFGENQYMVNCADPLVISARDGIDINFDESLWSFSDNAWQFNRTIYRDGSTHGTYQTWKLDEKSRLKTVEFVTERDKSNSILKYNYTTTGLLKRTTMTKFKYDNREQSQQQQEWFYDQKHRVSIMITYGGPYRQFKPQQLSHYKKKLEQAIRTGYTGNMPAFDSNRVKQLVVYNYGIFGIQQVNCYHNEDWRDDDKHLLSDSLFYDTTGRISRYKGGKASFELQMEIIFTYDSIGGLLTKIIGHHYSSDDEVWSDDKIVQELTYDVTKKVSTLTESHYILTKVYSEGKYTEPKEVYFEGAYFKYNYLH